MAMKQAKKQKLGPNQKKWTRALRSGKFKKGRSKLCVVKNGKERYLLLPGSRR